MKNLGGGFKYFLFSPLWGNDPSWRAYFSDGLVQPPARWRTGALAFCWRNLQNASKSSQKFGESAGWLVGGNSDRGATPGVLRGSGATFLYTLTENVQWIAWRGRWARTRTLEFYLQEVAAQLLLHQLSPISSCGAGKALVHKLEAFAKEEGHFAIILLAAPSAIAFYEWLGYHAGGACWNNTRLIRCMGLVYLLPFPF